MKFSTKAEYGLRAVLYLAKHYPYLKSITDISIEENISAKYLEQIFNVLRNSEIIVSQKGKSGGYTLAKKPNELTVGEIVETLEGKIEATKCQSANCQNSKCAAKQVWVKLSREIKKTLNNIKLNDLIK